MKRVGNSIKGILGGFVLLLIGIILLWWNEGNNVRNIKTTNEMSKVYVDVSSEKVEATNEGKLVATHGKLINTQVMTDETFNVTIETPVLERIVEIYQWEEDSSTDDDGDTTYSYKKVWSSHIIDSGNFHQGGHDNPAVKPYEDQKWTSTDVKVGAFDLSTKQIDMLSTDGKYNDFNLDTITALGYKVEGLYVTNSDNLSSPKIGDVRISFVYNNSTEVSVLAVQSGNSFIDFTSEAGKNVNRVMDGAHNGQDMINVIVKENNMIKWILRAAGILLLALGFGTILKPLSAVTSYVPLVGNVVGAAVGLVSFLLALALGFVIIAIAWIRFRPLLGIGLLVAVVAIIVLLKIRSKKAGEAKTE